MKRFEDLRSKNDAEIEADTTQLQESLLRKGAGLVVKGVEKRKANEAKRKFVSAKQKLRVLSTDDTEERLRKQNEALEEMLDGMLALSQQVSAATTLGLTSVLLTQKSDTLVARALKQLRLS